MKSLSDHQVSERLPVRKWIPTPMQIRQYAEASGDFNPIHLDDNYARQAGLGGVIAHGMLSMAQMAAMLTDWIGDEGIISKIDVRFEQMVRPGDTVLCSGFIRARSEKVLVCDLAAFNERDERVLSGLAHITIN
ncbi:MULTISPECIES: MaoC/PaaZ C-terminal domain-containing protein [Desulfosporosinus]|uniref:Bifunctional enoyl-CoA hydratase/phosphate acetyltransferase n=1 Tax=Desulfosporosinus acididurans TaxID=476652 RepID=A0A0J1FRC3_9FIRM|nr:MULTISPECIES: MaoC/PaaZ C-terminal domain-containing protein [Desulfosporosinus]KLU65523.1 bifunctional enoyl-CoA hydratase/phosphate acetyltransferase [Desulfosporosinus acididurans]